MTPVPESVEEAVKRVTAWLNDPVTGAYPIASPMRTILAALAQGPKEAAQPPSLTFSDERAPPNPQEAEGWLPIVLCPTDGVNRALLLPDGEEVVGSFGEPSNRWRVWRASIPIPSRPLEPIGGVLRETAPYRMRVVSDLPTNVYPTHFRPNDTVFGRPASPTPQGEGRGE